MRPAYVHTVSFVAVVLQLGSATFRTFLKIELEMDIDASAFTSPT